MTQLFHSIRNSLKNRNNLFIVIILVAIIFLFLGPTFIQNDLCCDFMGQPVPWYEFLQQNLKEGVLPFWSTYSYLGQPFLFTPTLAFFHPLTLLIILLNFIINFNPSIEVTGQIIEFVVILSLCIGGIGMYVLCRRIFNLSKLAALFVAIVFSLNPYRLYDIESLFVDWVVSSLPWIILVLSLFLTKPTFRLYLILTFLNVLIFAAGYPYYYVYFIAIEFLLVGFYGYKKIVLFCLSLINSFLLSGFFLLPYLSVFFHSARTTSDYSFIFHSFASFFPQNLLQIVEPLSYSVNLVAPNTADIIAGPTLTWGTFAFIFLIYGFFFLKNKPIYLWIILVFFISLFYSFGSNLATHSFFGTLLPLIYKFRTHARILHITLFAGALLIGFGVDAISKRYRVKYFLLAFWFICLSFFIGLTLGLVFFWDKIAVNSEVYKGTIIMLLFLFTSTMIVTLTLKYKTKLFLVLGLVVLLIEYHYYFVNMKGLFTKNEITYDMFYRVNQTIQEQPYKDNLFRIYFESPFANNSAIIKQYGLQGYESNPPQVYGSLIETYGFSPHFWRITNVKYIVTTKKDFAINNPGLVYKRSVTILDDRYEPLQPIPPQEYYIYEVENYLPRYYIPERAQPCLDDKCWKKENAPQSVFVKDLSDSITNNVKETKITMENYTVNSITMKVIAHQKTFVASSETYDTGWKIRINNNLSKIYFTSNGLRGFIVPAGVSIVEMDYFPPYLRTGVFLSLLGLVILIVVKKWFYKNYEKIR